MSRLNFISHSIILATLLFCYSEENSKSAPYSTVALTRLDCVITSPILKAINLVAKDLRKTQGANLSEYSYSVHADEQNIYISPRLDPSQLGLLIGGGYNYKLSKDGETILSNEIAQ